jgi:serine/threonine protein kinase
MIGKLVGGYKILEKVGEGGMGEVFRGLDEMLEREVAIKVLRPEFARRQDIVERFRTEAIALARLSHPNILMLYSFFRHEEQYFMVLEFVRGETLDKLIARRGAVSWRKAISLICQALDGLEHAHEWGVVHRDLKPANLILTSAGTLKVMDFGIARILEKARTTRTGQLFGTLEYMSPEQIQGWETDARSDLYSLGAVLYELLTGHPPFQSSSDYGLIRSQVEELPRSPCALMPQIPAALEAVVMRALAKLPQDRFPHAAGLRAVLEGLLKDLPSTDENSQENLEVPQTRLGIQPSVFLAEQSSPAPESYRQPVQAMALVDRPAVTQKLTARFAWRDYPGIAFVIMLFSVTLVLVGVASKHGGLSLIMPVNQVERAQAGATTSVGSVRAEHSATASAVVLSGTGTASSKEEALDTAQSVTETAQQHLPANRTTSPVEVSDSAAEQLRQNLSSPASLPVQTGLSKSSAPPDKGSPRPSLTSLTEEKSVPVQTLNRRLEEDSTAASNHNTSKKKSASKTMDNTLLSKSQKSNANGWSIRK